MVEGEQKYKQAMRSMTESNKSFGSSAGSLGDQVKDLSSKLGVSLPEGATKALDGMQGFSSGTIAAMGAAAAGVAALISACKELHEITLQAAEEAYELITKSLVTGLSTGTLQQWTYAENLIDVSVGTMIGSMTKLTRAMYDAQTGNKAAAETFQALGISITDSNGQLRDAESVFYEVIDAMGGVESQTERDAIAMEIMGRSAQDLNPLILQGSDALRELADEAESAGYILDDSQIKKLGEVDDAYQRTQLQIEATKNQLAVEFAPASKAAMETFGEVVSVAGQALIDSGIIQNTASLIEIVGGVIQKGTELASIIPSWLNPVKHLADQFQFLNGVLLLTGDLLGVTSKSTMKNYGGLGSDIAGAEWKDDVQAWVSAGGTIIGDWNYKDFDKSTGKLTRVFDSGSLGDIVSYGHMDEAAIRRLVGHNSAGTVNWHGGLTWVGESGPELVNLPRGSSVYSNQESKQLAGNVYIDHVIIDAKNVDDFNRVVTWFDSRRVISRMQ